MGVIWEVSLSEFIFVTLVLGGAAAWMTGRAVAYQWHGLLRALAWMVFLSAAVRFIHYALFSGTLLSLHYYLVDLVILCAFAALGHRRTRTKQMTRQYGWINELSGPFSWCRRGVSQDAGNAAS
jgi:hypothetical protein